MFYLVILSFLILGIAEEKSIVREPQLIALNLQNDKITQFHLGSEHGLLLTQKGKMYSWGWNEHGSCGNGTVDNQYVKLNYILQSIYITVI